MTTSKRQAPESWFGGDLKDAKAALQIIAKSSGSISLVEALRQIILQLKREYDARGGVFLIHQLALLADDEQQLLSQFRALPIEERPQVIQGLARGGYLHKKAA